MKDWRASIFRVTLYFDFREKENGEFNKMVSSTLTSQTGSGYIFMGVMVLLYLFFPLIPIRTVIFRKAYM